MCPCNPLAYPDGSDARRHEGAGVKKTLLTYSSFIPPLRPMYDSVMMLNDINKHDPVCIMTIVATTWGNSREVCTRNQALLKSALEGWGYAAPPQPSVIRDVPG